MIVAPGLLPNERRHLEWWQYLPGREQPSALHVDLNPDSLGFYDYDTAEWFSVPRRTGVGTLWVPMSTPSALTAIS